MCAVGLQEGRTAVAVDLKEVKTQLLKCFLSRISNIKDLTTVNQSLRLSFVLSNAQVQLGAELFEMPISRNAVEPTPEQFHRYRNPHNISNMNIYGVSLCSQRGDNLCIEKINL